MENCAYLWRNPGYAPGEVTCNGLASHPEGVEILLAASCYGNRDKLWQYEPVWLIRLHFNSNVIEKIEKIRSILENWSPED